MRNSDASILLADDDPSLRELLADLLNSQGYHTVAVSNGREAIEALEKERFHLLLTDLRMPGMGGGRLVEECLKRWPDLPLIVLTAYGSIEDALELIRKGVYDYIPKPHKEKDLLLRIARALERERLTSEITVLRKALVERRQDRILGDDPVVRVNCGAIPRELFESEVFGYARGAFTGAQAERKGLFEEADGGTLFLDEISDIAQEHQVKLLRALQEGEIKRVGENTVRRVNVRIISASNRDLAVAVREGQIREDLYYRLNVMPIRLPPLRERRGDLLPLAQHLLERESAAMQKPMKGFSRAAAEKILEYPWPGNVRELENKIKQALVLASTGQIDASDLLLDDATLLKRPAEEGKPEFDASSGFPSFNEARRRFEREYLVDVLTRSRGNATAAAREAGKHRSEFYDLIKRHGLQPADFRAGGTGPAGNAHLPT